MAIEVERDYIQKWTEVYLPNHKSKIETMDYIIFIKDDINFTIRTDIRTLFYRTMMSFCGFSVVFKEFERIFLNVLEGNLDESFVGRDLKDYGLETELPLETTNGYMKADIMLIKQDKITGRVNDVIIIENKLNTTTPYTKRQKEGFGAIVNNIKHTMKVKYSRSNFNVNRNPTLTIEKHKIFRIDDHGTDNISNVNINKISNL